MKRPNDNLPDTSKLTADDLLGVGDEKFTLKQLASRFKQLLIVGQPHERAARFQAARSALKKYEYIALPEEVAGDILALVIDTTLTRGQNPLVENLFQDFTARYGHHFKPHHIAILLSNVGGHRDRPSRQPILAAYAEQMVRANPALMPKAFTELERAIGELNAKGYIPISSERTLLASLRDVTKRLAISLDEAPTALLPGGGASSNSPQETRVLPAPERPSAGNGKKAAAKKLRKPTGQRKFDFES